jgi:hypothetical protein
VIGPGSTGFLQSCHGAQQARFRVEGGAYAQELKTPQWQSAPFVMVALEQVQIGEVRENTHAE